MTDQPPVTFDFQAWSKRYPEFGNVDPDVAALYFGEATLYCANSLKRVADVAQLTMLLYMLTAHVAALNSATTSSGKDPLTPPGRVASASEGSVSVTFDAGSTTGSEAWFKQTKYGFAFWQATLQYRSFKYYTGHNSNRFAGGPFGPFGRGAV